MKALIALTPWRLNAEMPIAHAPLLQEDEKTSAAEPAPAASADASEASEAAGKSAGGAQKKKDNKKGKKGKKGKDDDWSDDDDDKPKASAAADDEEDDEVRPFRTVHPSSFTHLHLPIRSDPHRLPHAALSLQVPAKKPAKKDKKGKPAAAGFAALLAVDDEVSFSHQLVAY